MTGAGERAAISAREQVRWERWQTRYDRSARRTTLQARVVAIIVFSAIAANLLAQLLLSSR